MKERLREKFIVIKTNIKKIQVNNLTFYLRKPAKENKTKLKASRRREIVKIRADINELQKNKIIEKYQ